MVFAASIFCHILYQHFWSTHISCNRLKTSNSYSCMKIILNKLSFNLIHQIMHFILAIINDSDWMIMPVASVSFINLNNHSQFLSGIVFVTTLSIINFRIITDTICPICKSLEMFVHNVKYNMQQYMCDIDNNINYL